MNNFTRITLATIGSFALFSLSSCSCGCGKKKMQTQDAAVGAQAVQKTEKAQKATQKVSAETKPGALVL